jgi:hypothetical protein
MVLLLNGTQLVKWQMDWNLEMGSTVTSVPEDLCVQCTLLKPNLNFGIVHYTHVRFDKEEGVDGGCGTVEHVIEY